MEGGLPASDIWVVQQKLIPAAYMRDASPDVASYGDNVYLVWGVRDEEDRTKTNIWIKGSNNKGVAWDVERKITSIYQPGGAPLQEIASEIVCADSNGIHVILLKRKVHEQYALYSLNSFDGGKSWRSDSIFTEYSSSYPSIASNGNTLYVAWVVNFEESPKNSDIYFAKSDDGGISWSRPTKLTNDAKESTMPDIAVEGNNIHVVWADAKDAGKFEHRDIYYIRSFDGGKTWLSVKRLTYLQDRAAYTHQSTVFWPSVAVNGESLHVVWVGSKGNSYSTFYKKSPDNGNRWSADKQITNMGSPRGYSITLAPDGEKPHLVHLYLLSSGLGKIFLFEGQRTYVPHEDTLETIIPVFPEITTPEVAPNPAKAGEIKITFSVSDIVNNLPAVTVGEESANHSATKGLAYSYTYNVTENAPQGEVQIVIDVKDAHGHVVTNDTVIKGIFLQNLCDGQCSGGGRKRTHLFIPSAGVAAF